MATYPAAVYSPRTKNNKEGVVYTPSEDTTLFAEDVTLDDAEIVAIETELGTNPKGAKADVKTRLDDVDTAIGTKISKTIASQLSAMTPKSALVDGDIFLIEDSEVSNAKKMTLWSSIKSVLKTYFDSLYLALSGGTLTGSITFGENTSLNLDPALSADGKYCGIVEAGNSGYALEFGQLCYFEDADSQWYKADANVSAGYDKKLGICIAGVAGGGQPTGFLLFGKVRADAQFPNLEIGKPVYLGETAGEILTTAPVTVDACIRKIGYGNTANELFFNPSNNLVLNSDKVGTVASSATPTINTDTYSNYTITALAEAITSFTTNLSGTPYNFQKLIIRIKDNGTARAIAWGASFEDAGVALPTTTVISKLLTVGFIYNSVTSKWGCVAVANET